MASEWVKFSDLFAVAQKNGLTRPKRVRGAGLPMVNMGELFAYPRIEDVPMDLVPLSDAEHQFLLEPGDLLFARQSLVLSGAGQCSIFLGNTQPTVFESHIIRCRLDDGLADSKFYFYFFRSPAGRSVIEQIVEQGAGASGIRGSDLAMIKVPKLPLEKQHEISAVLSVLDDRIDNLRQTNATLEAIAQALFKSWFVDFDPVRAKAEGREPEGMDATTAALFPAEFDSDNALPCGWAWVKLGDVFDVGIGKTPPRKEAQWFSQSVEDVPWVSIRDMGEAGVFLMNTAEKLTTEAVTRFNVRCVPAGTVMMSFKLTVGRVAISDGVLTTNEAIAHFKSMPESLPQSYLYCYLKSYDMDSIASTSSIATATNSKAIRGLAITHPGDPLALAFNDAVAPLFERIRMQQKQANTLSEIRDTILPRLISGELRLPDVEREVEAVTA